MKVSLITTVKDAAPRVAPFLESVREQTRAPDEVVVVDGGSSDGTAEAFERSGEVRLIRRPGANIAAGRNAAIAEASHDVLAVTDADCVLAPTWLERISAPLSDGADVAKGFYRAAPGSFLQACAAAVSVPEPEEVDPLAFMPSARSVAFTRAAIGAVGGYPEWLDYGEDMWVNHRWRELGMRMAFVPEAVAYWPPRATLAATWRQYANYARGDAEAGMYPQRHRIRYAAYALGALALSSRRRSPVAAVAMAGAYYVRRPVRRARRLLAGRSRQQAAAAVAVPALMAFIDAAKMYGYASGRRRSR